MSGQLDVAIAGGSTVHNITTEIRSGGPEVIEEMALPWCSLWDQVSEDPFYRPEWVLAYLRSFNSKSLIWLVTAFLGERLVAVLPLVKEAAFFRGLPVRQLRGAACVHSVRFDLLRAPGALGVAATKAIWHALEQTRGWDLIEIPYTPLNGNAVDLLQHAEEAGFPTATDVASRSRYVKVAGCSDGKLNLDPPLGSHFRTQLGRWARRFEKTFAVPPELTITREADTGLLQDFYDLEASGWKGRAGTAIKSRADTRMFYDEVARIAGKLGCFRLACLRANGRLISAEFFLAISKNLLLLKVGYDESLSRAAPGHLLFERILRTCGDEGIQQMEFGGDDEPYKRLWTPHTRDYLKVYLFKRGAYGRLLRFHKLAVVPRFKHILSQIQKVFRSEAEKEEH
jgi:CelD/BcsL family acetyltransferase involved in cellulose biosynthesis